MTLSPGLARKLSTSLAPALCAALLVHVTPAPLAALQEPADAGVAADTAASSRRAASPRLAVPHAATPRLAVPRIASPLAAALSAQAPLIAAIGATPLPPDLHPARVPDAAQAPGASSRAAGGIAQTLEEQEEGFPLMRVAKWGSLAAAAGSAAWGFALGERAERAFAPLEALCEREAGTCSGTGADEAQVGLRVEDDFQRVRSLDSRARTALLAAQVGLAVAAVLFLVDLSRADAPEDIPFEPPRLRIAPDGAVGVEARILVGGK